MTREQKMKVLDKGKTILKKLLHASKVIGEVLLEAKASSAEAYVKRNYTL